METNNIKDFYKRKVKRNLIILSTLFILCIIVSIVSLSIGASNTNLLDVFRLIGNAFGAHFNVSALSRVVIEQLRLPRICMGILVGLALSNSGLLMQAIFQNPLVSPYTLGISSGAAFGAALSIVLGEQFGVLGQYALPINAFVFSIITIVIVYLVSKTTKSAGKNIVLIGVAVGYLFSALLSFLQYTGTSKQLPEIIFWIMGSLDNIGWTPVIILLVVNIVSLIIMFIYAWDLNIVSYGRDTAVSFGVNYDKIRIISIILATLLTGTCVAFTGIIGFVGLIAPQMARIIIGSDYRFLIPGASLTGALLVVLSDTIARNLMSPVELPIGIITSFVGVPFFLYLIIRKKSSN